jgi:hypothetical protein
MRTYCVYLRRVKPDSAAGSAEALGALGLVREDGSMDCGLLSRALGGDDGGLMTCGGAINMMPVDIYSPINTMAAALAALLDSAFIDASGMASRPWPRSACS